MKTTKLAPLIVVMVAVLLGHPLPAPAHATGDFMSQAENSDIGAVGLSGSLSRMTDSSGSLSISGAGADIIRVL